MNTTPTLVPSQAAPSLLLSLACVMLNLRDRYKQTLAAIQEMTERNGQTTLFIAVDAISSGDHRAAATGTVP